MSRGVPDERKPILFLIDEAPLIGHIDALEKAVTVKRGYGFRFWFFVQSMNQVQTCYGKKAQTFLDNMDTKQFFAISSSPETNELIVKLLGKFTLSLKTRSRSWGRSWPDGPSKDGVQPGTISENVSDNENQIGRPLFFEDEIRTMPDNRGLVFHKNMPPMQVELPRYYSDPAFENSGTGANRPIGKRGVNLAKIALAGSILAAVGVFAILPSRRASPPEYVFPDVKAVQSRAEELRALQGLGERRDGYVPPLPYPYPAASNVPMQWPQEVRQNQPPRITPPGWSPGAAPVPLRRPRGYQWRLPDRAKRPGFQPLTPDSFGKGAFDGGE